MKDTAEIRKHNMNKIRRLLWLGNNYSKHDIALTTGLSVATCNTLLNELEANKEVIPEKKQLSGVGRCTALYRINEDYENILCLTFEMSGKQRLIKIFVLSMTGNIIWKIEIFKDNLRYTDIEKIIMDVIKKYSKINRISISVPGIVMDGIISDCDISELNGIRLIEKLKEKLNTAIEMENDMHYKAYGYYKEECTDDEIVTIINYQPGVLPGTATIYQGKILKGANGLAGMTGFLPFDTDRQKQIEMMNSEQYFPFALKSAVSLIAILNPDLMVFTGNLITIEASEKIYKSSKNYIPDKYMPELKYIENIDDYCLIGMYKKSLEM